MPEEATESVNPWGPGGASYADWEADTWATSPAATSAAEALSAGRTPDRVVLAKPVFIKQSGSTCWAATLASWRGATGRPAATLDAVMTEYRGKGLVGLGGEMTFANGQTMLAMEGMQSASMAGANVTYERLRGLLQAPGGRNYVYLVYQPPNAGFSHAILVYGVERTRTDDMALAMNPLKDSVPAYVFLSDFVGQGVLIASVAGT